ncbi:hypothetical protein NDU88_005531, partial [Pleurodeles waltl]
GQQLCRFPQQETPTSPRVGTSLTSPPPIFPIGSNTKRPLSHGKKCQMPRLSLLALTPTLQGQRTMDKLFWDISLCFSASH